MAFRFAVLTVSDRGFRGERVDTSGPAIRELLTGIGGVPVAEALVPDEGEQIQAQIRRWCDAGEADVVLTTGGTGLSPRDVTADATRAVLDYEAPGIAEAMRAEGMRHTPMAMLSRAVAGVRNRVLVINLPGSERSVRENLPVLLPVIQHAVDTLRGGERDHAPGGV